MASLRNTHFYEMALIGPGMANCVPPVYACGYADQPEALDAEGCVPLPEGPGLGVTYDWDFVERTRPPVWSTTKGRGRHRALSRTGPSCRADDSILNLLPIPWGNQ